MRAFLTEDLIWELIRVSLGFIMLWAFLDKLLGLGFATSKEGSWLEGVSPTAGFLKFGAEGPFSPLFQSFSGSLVIDLLFMAGLFLVGASLILGIGIKIAGYAGALMTFLIYLSLFPPENNPIIDEHIIYIILFLGLANTQKGRKYSFSKQWATLDLVKKYPILV
ncbi:MAG: hypothetical protein HYW63_03035 [Candidatus Levybacteria bacterium]|nr:hypothetical protein [Candidatus Levybacteria bacterium]